MFFFTLTINWSEMMMMIRNTIGPIQCKQTNKQSSNQPIESTECDVRSTIIAGAGAATAANTYTSRLYFVCWIEYHELNSIVVRAHVCMYASVCVF